MGEINGEITPFPYGEPKKKPKKTNFRLILDFNGTKTILDSDKPKHVLLDDIDRYVKSIPGLTKKNLKVERF